MVYPPVQQAARKESNTLGIIAFVVSLFALFFCMGEAKLTIATGIAAGLSISLTMAAFYMANRYHLRLGLTVTALVLSCLAMLFFV